MSDSLSGAALAAVAGMGLSYVLSTIPGARDLFESVPSKFKALVLFAAFIVLAAGLVALKCYGLFDAGVVCPASVPDGVKLALYTLSAYGGSQLAHSAGGGRDLNVAG
jgi:hypothetical protein